MTKPAVITTTQVNGQESAYRNKSYTRFGVVTPGNTDADYYPEIANALWVGGNGGDVVFETIDNEPMVIHDVPTGTLLQIEHRRVYTTATVDGNLETTGASNMTWWGGS